MNNFFNDDLDQYLHQINSGESNVDQNDKEHTKKVDNIPSYSTKKGEKSARLKSTSSLCIKNISPQIKQEHLSASPHEEGLSIHSLDKKERNRMAAKQSRDRKKLYIELMQYEQKKLEAELCDVGKEIDEMKNKINKFTTQNKTITGFSTPNQLQIKLKQILDKNDTVQQQEEIMIVLDSMTFRMGATGKQRLQKQKQCHKQMLNLFLPPLHRYVMWAAPQGRHIWNPNFANEMEDFQCSLIPQVVSMNQIPDQMQMFREKVKQTKEKLLYLIKTLEEKKENVENIIKNLEQEVDCLRDILTPSQCAKLLIFANNNRYRKQLLFFEQDDIDQSIFKSSFPQKKVKKEREPNTE